MHYDPPHNDESLSSATVGPGALLRQARLARGWEPQEVASRLSVRPELVQAIENDDFSLLGAPIFAKGFVQRYARLVGVPEQEALERLRRSVRPEPPPLRVTHHVKPQAKSSDLRWLTYPLVLLLVGWLAWWGFEQANRLLAGGRLSLPGIGDGAQSGTPLALPEANVPAAPAVPMTPVATSALPLPAAPEPPTVAVTPAGALSVGDGSVTAVAIPAEPGIAQPEAPSAEAEALDNVAAVAPAPAAPTSAPVAVGAQATLVIKVAEDCWAEVKDAGGNRLAYGVLKANSETTVSGRPPFSLILGNAQAVSITLNGKPVAAELYKPKRGTVSRFQLNLPAQ